MQHIPTNIRLLRESRKITQEAIAFHLGITQGAFAKLESGQSKISIDRLQAIADFFQVALSDLLMHKKD